ncbi:C2H2 type zinc finger domain protein [Colletotrichum karsti]|uniref:C2H2 type zinc finger domain protein n=1 Tax=Colletotrichum karsti TaxID=1095194 RepID=A0A9P6HZ74_9PEZI|nr:C2H2 type zinc finger domain protein [Colletotrichum karsti]KAF9871856.1 C2H2 type zinc finger domain protein [Colletotrichum karsti]
MVGSSPSPSSGLLAACMAPPNPVILSTPLTTTGISPTGLLTHATMPPAPMTMNDTFDFAPGSMLDDGMRLQLQSVYFDQFHPQWPMLHRETFESTLQPKLLMQAVITVGLWFSSAPGSKDLAVRFHDHLLAEVGNRILELLEQSRQGLLSPRLDLLPIFQAMLISTILVPYRADKTMENVMMTHSMLLETFKATGIYDQAKINAASHLCGTSGYPWVFRESYQRLAVFQFKLHLILQAVFITIYPALRISRNAEPAMLRVKVPMPLMMWDGPAAQWFGMIPTDPELLDDGDDDVLVISKMCDKAIMMMDNKPLLPLLSWDRCLGMAIWFPNMGDTVNWTRVLQLVNVVGAAHLAGYHWASDQIAMHNILQLRDKDIITQQWFRGWDFGRVYGPAMVIGTASVFGFLAWKDGTQSPSFIYNLAASVLMGFVGPYTQIRVFPVNDKLLAEHDRIVKGGKKADEQAKGASYEEVRQWAVDWKRLDLHRQMLAFSAVVAGLIAALRT